MTTMPTEAHLDWVAHVVGAGTEVRAIEGLHDGSSPWRLVIDDGATTYEAILRVAGWIPPDGINTGAAALRVAEKHGVWRRHD